MNTFIRLKYSILTLIIAFTAFGCSLNSSDNNEERATINGSVEEETAQQKSKISNIEGATVTAAQVSSNGSLEMMDGVETETNASGNFTLDVDVESAQNIAIIAEKEGKTWMGYLSSKVENGNSYTLKPINSESSAETEVFTKLVASGNADIVNKADVESVVSSQVAAQIRSNVSYATTIATGLKNAAEARAEYYNETLGSESQAALESTFEAMAQAQFQLESELATAASAEQRAEARDAFVESSVNAYLNAGLDASSSAKAIEMWSRIFVNSLTSVSSEVEDNARMQTSVLVAAAIDGAVRAEAEASNMSETSRQAIIDAGIQLRSAVKASAGVASDIKAAFDEYHEEVRSTMENDAAFEASVIIEIDTEINSPSGAKSSFTSSISSVLNASTVVNTYQTFYSDINGIVETTMNGAGQTEIETVTELMILINLAS